MSQVADFIPNTDRRNTVNLRSSEYNVPSLTINVSDLLLLMKRGLLQHGVPKVNQGHKMCANEVILGDNVKLVGSIGGPAVRSFMVSAISPPSSTLDKSPWMAMYITRRLSLSSFSRMASLRGWWLGGLERTVTQAWRVRSFLGRRRQAYESRRVTISGRLTSMTWWIRGGGGRYRIQTNPSREDRA